MTDQITIPTHGGRDPDGMNANRTAWAGECIDTFRRLTGSDHEDAVSDLLANLMHYCSATDQDFSNELRRACDHFEAETREG